jgi:hypothetical protein
MGESGPEKSSEVGARSLGASAGATSRPVFVSYASANAPLAQKVCTALEVSGFRAGSRLGMWLGARSMPLASSGRSTIREFWSSSSRKMPRQRSMQRAPSIRKRFTGS